MYSTTAKSMLKSPSYSAYSRTSGSRRMAAIFFQLVWESVCSSEPW